MKRDNRTLPRTGTFYAPLHLFCDGERYRLNHAAGDGDEHPEHVGPGFFGINVHAGDVVIVNGWAYVVTLDCQRRLVLALDPLGEHGRARALLAERDDARGAADRFRARYFDKCTELAEAEAAHHKTRQTVQTYRNRSRKLAARARGYRDRLNRAERRAGEAIRDADRARADLLRVTTVADQLRNAPPRINPSARALSLLVCETLSDGIPHWGMTDEDTRAAVALAVSVLSAPESPDPLNLHVREAARAALELLDDPNAGPDDHMRIAAVAEGLRSALKGV